MMWNMDLKFRRVIQQQQINFKVFPWFCDNFNDYLHAISSPSYYTLINQEFEICGIHAYCIVDMINIDR